jgi:hypothetical protein
VANRKSKRSRTGRGGSNLGVAAQEATIARDQATRVRVGPEIGTLTEKDDLPQIRLKTGATVGAREAAAIWRSLGALLAVDPDEFGSLLALAQDRPGDADQRHFKSLRADAFLQDDHSVDPVVRDVLLNSFELTPEGPVISPLRLQNAADRPIAEQALRERDEWVQNFAGGGKGTDRSRE